MKIQIGTWSGFTAEDFVEISVPSTNHTTYCSALAAQANAILAAKLGEAPEVYGNIDEPRGMETALCWAEGGPLSSSTHTARLVCIEGVKK